MVDVLVPVVLVLLVAVVLVEVPVRQGLRPLRRLQRQLSMRQPGALEPVVLPHAVDELVPVVQTFNRLLADLQRSQDAQKRFIADAAHELRTPVTALALELNNLQAAQTPQEQAAAVQRLQQGVARAQRRMEQMLTLARLETRGQPAPGLPTDLAALVRQCLVDWYLPAQRRQVDLVAQVVEPCWVQTQPEDARLLLDNLLHNAIKRAPAGTEVVLTLQPGSGPQPSTMLVLRDHGPGLPETVRQRIGQPFNRGPGATEGAGLGLSIALEAAMQAGVVLEWKQPDDGPGLQVVMKWQPAPAGDCAQRTAT